MLDKQNISIFRPCTLYGTVHQMTVIQTIYLQRDEKQLTTKGAIHKPTVYTAAMTKYGNTNSISTGQVTVNYHS